MSSRPPFPFIFIVGAPKAGTTALHAFLEKHPEVCMSSDKEPNFFSWKEIEQQQLYYSKKNVKTEDDYYALYHPGPSTRICGEGSVSYLFYPECPARIQAFDPEAKIIISLRDPVKRAFSHFQMDYSLGLTPFTFEEIWNNGIGHPKSGVYFQQYFLLSLYYEQVKRYLDRFPGHVMILFHDDLIKQQQKAIADLCSFLQISALPASAAIEQQNVTAAGKNVLVRALYKNEGFRKMIGAIAGEKVRTKIKSILFTKNALPQLTPALESTLRNYYDADVRKLGVLLNKDLRHWQASNNS